MPEEQTPYEAGNPEADPFSKEMNPFDKETDPFSEEMSPAIEYVVERWGHLSPNALDHQQVIVIEGHISAMTVRWEMKRNVAGAYTSDTVSGYARLEPQLKCDIVVNKPLPGIKSSNGDLAVVGEVFRRFGQELGRQTYDLIVEHNKTVFALKDGKPQPPPRVSNMGKEVQRKSEVAL